VGVGAFCLCDELCLLVFELCGEVVDDGVAGVEFVLEVVEFLGAALDGGLVFGEVGTLGVEVLLQGAVLSVCVGEFGVELLEGSVVVFVLVEGLCEEYFCLGECVVGGVGVLGVLDELCLLLVELGGEVCDDAVAFVDGVAVLFELLAEVLGGFVQAVFCFCLLVL